MLLQAHLTDADSCAASGRSTARRFVTHLMTPCRFFFRVVHHVVHKTDFVETDEDFSWRFVGRVGLNNDQKDEAEGMRQQYRLRAEVITSHQANSSHSSAQLSAAAN